MSFGGAALVVLLLGAAAAIVPAWRAGTVDPATVLREQ
jgi:ABC-type lipoprotein release transport system permease subunit